MERNKKREFTAILRQLEKFGYLGLLNDISRVLQGKLWLIGGWVRNAFIGPSYYGGDIDCLCMLPHEDIVRSLRDLSIVIERNRYNGIRVQLFDGNYITIVPVADLPRAETIADALACFNFSINSAAFKYDEGTFECTEGFLEDVARRSLRLNDNYIRKSEHKKGLFKDAESFIHHYGLVPSNHGPTLALLAEIQAEKQSLQNLSWPEKMDRGRCRIHESLGPLHSVWIVRGYFRCSLLGELSYWDDLDVATTLGKNDITALLNQRGQCYIKNYFGNPKIYLDDGTTIDIWSLPSGYTIADEIASYSHNIDSIAWHIDSQSVEDPLGIIPRLESQEVEVMERYSHSASREELAYTSIKTVYLCLRHDLKPGMQARALLRSGISTDGFLQANVSRLSKELTCAAGGPVIHSLENFRSTIGNSPALELMAQQFRIR